MFQVAAKPQSVFEIVADSLRLYKTAFLKLLPFFVIIAALIVGADVVFVHQASPWVLTYHYGIIVLLSLLEFFFLISVVYQCSQIMHREKTDYGCAMKVGLRKYLIALVASILYFLSIMIGSVLLIFPGIFCYFLFIFYLPLILIDNQGIIVSLKNSVKLIWGYWWRTFFLFGFLTVAFHLLMRLIEDLTKIPVMLNVHAWKTMAHANVWSHTITFFAVLIVWPLFLSLLLTQYHDLKIRYKLRCHSDKLIESLRGL